MRMHNQVIVFLLSCVMGLIIGIIFDTIRVVSQRFNKIIIFFADVIFFILSGLITFGYILVSNDGNIRGYLIVGEVLGLIIYFSSISKHVYKVMDLVVRIIMAIIAKMKSVLMRIKDIKKIKVKYCIIKKSYKKDNLDLKLHK